MNRTKIAVLISGRGSNLKAILESTKLVDLIEVIAVISNNPEASGLLFAKERQIPTLVLDHRLFSTRTQFDEQLVRVLDELNPDLIVLAGFMRILTNTFTDHYTGKILNIHPSLLPKFKGLNTHERAIESGEVEHGVSIHFVTSELDGGPILSQAKLTVNPNETPSSLATRVLQLEHQLYPATLSYMSQHQLSLKDSQIHKDGVILHYPLQLEELLNEYNTD